MKKIKDFFIRVWVCKQGQGLVEYGLIIALIAVVIITVLTTMGGELTNKFSQINDAIK